MFVGITRAQQELQISLARYRDFRGQRKLTIPSSFLMELPRAEMEIEFPEEAADRLPTCPMKTTEGRLATCPTRTPSKTVPIRRAAGGNFAVTRAASSVVDHGGGVGQRGPSRAARPRRLPPRNGGAPFRLRFGPGRRP